MSIKSDTWIARMSRERRMIEPFEEKQVREGVISFGVSSYGYDIRIADEFKIFTPSENHASCGGSQGTRTSRSVNQPEQGVTRDPNLLTGSTHVDSGVIDPKHFDPKSFTDFKGPICVIPPNSFVLGRTVEYFRIPRNVLTICFGKSTYARCGIVVNVTPFEPEWEGYATLAISNPTPLPARLYANEGIAQILFLESDEVCATSYADKKGKYQAQQNITTSKI